MIKASIVTIGDELLIGQVIDTNSAWIAQRLNELGIDIVGKYSASDDKESMVSLLKFISQNSDIVFMTGGLGPTKDDITKLALIDYFEDDLAFSEETYEKLAGMFRARGKEPGPSHKEQCFLPSKAKLFQNPQGTAPAMLLENDGLTLFAMPGVPYEMKALMTEAILPYVKSHFDSETIVHKTIMTGGVGESTLAEMITDIEDELPENISLAYLPSLGFVRLRLTTKGNDEKVLKDNLSKFADRISTRLGDKVWGYDDESIVKIISDLCHQKGLKIGLAESCTGGTVAQKIVAQAGSSSFFEGGAVVYSNRMKKLLLGVKDETLSSYGAVSEQTVKEMAKGAVKSFGVDVAVSISGIAGPDGGSQEKPVGTTWIGVSDGKRTEAYLIKGFKNRKNNIEYASNRALLILHSFLKAK